MATDMYMWLHEALLIIWQLFNVIALALHVPAWCAEVCGACECSVGWLKHVHVCVHVHECFPTTQAWIQSSCEIDDSLKHYPMLLDERTCLTISNSSCWFHHIKSKQFEQMIHNDNCMHNDSFTLSEASPWTQLVQYSSPHQWELAHESNMIADVIPHVVCISKIIFDYPLPKYIYIAKITHHILVPKGVCLAGLLRSLLLHACL